MKTVTIPEPPEQPEHTPISIKRGSGKHIIKYIADDFTAPLDDFEDYMTTTLPI